MKLRQLHRAPSHSIPHRLTLATCPTTRTRSLAPHPPLTIPNQTPPPTRPPAPCTHLRQVGLVCLQEARWRRQVGGDLQPPLLQVVAPQAGHAAQAPVQVHAPVHARVCLCVCVCFCFGGGGGGREGGEGVTFVISIRSGRGARGESGGGSEGKGG